MPGVVASRVAGALAAPTSLREFSRRFASEGACEEYLFAVRYPSGFVCPRCGSDQGWPLDGKRLVECANGHKVSLTAGTVLHRTRLDLVTWFHAAYLISTLTPGISALQFQRQLGLSRYETAFQLLHKLRSALVAPRRERLHGEVEMDDTLVGGKDPDRGGHGGDKVVVAGAVEVLRWKDRKTKRHRSRTGRVRLRVIPDTTAVSVMTFMHEEVTPGTAVHTDGSSSYWGADDSGYFHHPVIQGRGRGARYALTHLHRIFSNLKAWLRGTHRSRVAPKHLQAYLNEYTFRFNRRFWRGPAFVRALSLMMDTADHPTYQALYRAGRPKGWIHPGAGSTTTYGGHRS